jgi:hypothetical protein
MERSPEIGELTKALSIAQGKIKGAKADSDNPFFKSKYADLESVWAAIRIPLSDNGLAVIQCVDDNKLVTILSHSSGQFVQSSYPLTPKDQSPQSIGSAVSYARRYSLAAMTGVYQVDDDAEAAQARPAQQQRTVQNVQQQRAASPPPRNFAPNLKDVEDQKHASFPPAIRS